MPTLCISLKKNKIKWYHYLHAFIVTIMHIITLFLTLIQVVFNEALTKVVAEKEKKIDELQERATALQADSDKYRSE